MWNVRNRLTIRDLAILKNQLTSITAPHPDLVELLMRRETLERILDDERRDAFRAFLW